MKKWLILLPALGLVLTGCGRWDSSLRSVTPDMLADGEGGYAFSELPFGSSTADAEAALGLTLEEPSVVQGGIFSYSLQDVYGFDGKPVQTTLEFGDNGLQMLSFSLHGEEAELAELFSRAADTLTEAFGTADKAYENTKDVPELNISSVSFQGMQWVSSDGEPSTILQLDLVTGEKVNPSLSLALSILP